MVSTIIVSGSLGVAFAILCFLLIRDVINSGILDTNGRIVEFGLTVAVGIMLFGLVLYKYGLIAAVFDVALLGYLVFRRISFSQRSIKRKVEEFENTITLWLRKLQYADVAKVKDSVYIAGSVTFTVLIILGILSTYEYAVGSYIALTCLLLLLEVAVICGSYIQAKNHQEKIWKQCCYKLTGQGLSYLNPQITYVYKTMSQISDDDPVKLRLKKGLKDLLFMLFKVEDLKEQNGDIKNKIQIVVKKIVRQGQQLHIHEEAVEALHASKDELTRTSELLEEKVNEILAEVKEHVDWLFKLTANSVQDRKESASVSDIIDFHHESNATTQKAVELLSDEDETSQENQIDRRIEKTKSDID